MASQQSKCFCEPKSVIKPGERIALGNFSKNYSFILKDEAQGYQWNNAQSSIYHFTICIKESISAAVTH
jgi:hypothetical protein